MQKKFLLAFGGTLVALLLLPVVAKTGLITQ